MSSTWFLRKFVIPPEEDERGIRAEHSLSLCKIMDEMWESKGVWF
jgi:hypothetical protein